MSDASALIEYENYTGADKAVHQSRVATASTTWTIAATNKKTYSIKFDSNFAKKHLYTSTKKAGALQTKALALFVAAGSPKGKSSSDYMAQAQKELDGAKFQKQLGHRTQAEQLICGNCNHDRSKHFTKSGKALPPGPKCKTPACICKGWVEKTSYETGRAAALKPTANPLAGATTEKNTVLWMNKIDKAGFEKVVVESIVAREKALTGDWPTAGEHIKWDFGAAAKGCVVFIELAKGPHEWGEFQGVEVGIKPAPGHAADKPVYTVYHMIAGSQF